MEQRGDPQVIVFLERSAEFARRLELQRAGISALRSELDGFWVSNGPADSDVTWTYHPRRRREEERSA